MERSGLTVLITIWATFATAGWALAAEGVDFARQIRPLLSDRCFRCHGPEEASREGGFRLDVKDSAFGEADSGEHPIVPGDPGASELVRRITSEDEFERMPPVDSNKTLSAEEIEKIRQWIAAGAPWAEHWAFVPPTRPEPPKVSRPKWCRNPVDRFILARLDAEGLSPSPEASRERLIRRVTFDLTGLPPTIEEIDAFLSDKSPEAYERVVDRLLDSPHYGEHVARYWLDAARYGDTHGLHLDNYREMWPYRDWVIKAFNRNLPYDQFIVEQLAGDLLPEPTLEQLVATGFNRCHVTTNEGGSIKEEVYVRNVVDRVVTTAEVFMGLTFDCSRCHDHKYDPFTQKDFYSLFAFFNNLDGNPMDGNKAQHPPIVKVPTEEQQQTQAQLQQQLASLNEQIDALVADIEYDPEGDADASEEPQREDFVWFDDELPEGASAASEGQESGQWPWITAPEPVYAGERATKRTADGRSQHYFDKAKKTIRVGQGDTLFAHVYLDPEDPPKEIMLQWNTGSWSHRAYWGENLIDWGKDNSPERRHQGDLPEAGKWVRLEVKAADVGLEPGRIVSGWAFTQFGGTVYWDQAGLVTSLPQEPRTYTRLADWVRDQRAAGGEELPFPIDEIVKLERDKRSAEQQDELVRHFLIHAYQPARDAMRPLLDEIATIEKRLADLEKQIPTTLVYRERREPRPAYILYRGEYDQQRDEVQPNVPDILPPLPADAPRNRLGLAQWLVAPDHPLTARVAVNRFWQQVFGTGIVKTSEDFGSQGDPPSHPELLDWLAVEFRESGWDVKGLMKRLVMSATYRQTARVTPEVLARDPDNRLLARGPRFRLDAEMLRDQALAVSGLLVPAIGGPSVKPPQPDGLWFAVGYSGSNTVRFKADTDPQKTHRRTLYTFIKRTAPPPQLSTFDAPSRESFCVRRERTNTPLQALLLMNDPQYFEAARALARRCMRASEGDDRRCAAVMFRLCTSRRPADEHMEELLSAYRDLVAVYQDDPAAATKVIGQTEASEAVEDVKETEAARRAAWTLVANMVLNMDEVLTK